MFQTLFDLKSTSPVDWWTATAGLMLIVFFGTALIVTRGKGRFGGIPTWFGLGFALLWTFLSTVGPYLNYRYNLQLFESGHFQVAQGRVEALCSQPDGKGESFVLGGHIFSYSEFEGSGRFHQPHAFGGPVRKGLYLRVSYVGEDDIVRLEKRRTESLKQFPFKPQYTSGCD